MKKSRIITVLLVSLLGLGLFAAGCGQKSTAQTGTPKQVVTNWLNDLKSGNWSASYDSLTSADQKKMTRKQWVASYSSQGKPAADVSFAVTSEKITGDKATVTVKITEGGQSQSGPITLVKEGNTWKISASTSGQTDQTK
ncbi:MAG TPA: DUF4878 domain-containing protein [Candidatus Anoxymicrobiaceae bacterium]